MANGNQTRRQVLKLGASLPAAALAAAPVVLSARQARAQKMSKAQAQYQDQPKNDQRCDNCQFWIEGGECQIVAGEVAAEGWCALWAPAS
jgi:hypothetical protein